MSTRRMHEEGPTVTSSIAGFATIMCRHGRSLRPGPGPAPKAKTRPDQDIVKRPNGALDSSGVTGGYIRVVVFIQGERSCEPSII